MKVQILFLLFLFGVLIIEAGELFHVNGTDYYLSYPMRKNWFQAQRFCNYNGLHLITVHTFEEEQKILSVMKQFKIKYNITTEHIHIYTSGSDLGYLTNEFYWTTTGHPFIYTNWLGNLPSANDRPKPDLSYDCVILDDQFSLKWKNLNCSYDYFFMCQAQITVPQVNRGVDLSQCQIN